MSGMASTVQTQQQHCCQCPWSDRISTKDPYKIPYKTSGPGQGTGRCSFKLGQRRKKGKSTGMKSIE